MNDSERWALKNLAEAIAWASLRQRQNISTQLAPLGEYAQSIRQADESFRCYVDAIDAVSEASCDSALAIKLSALGLLFDEKLARNLFFDLLVKARSSDVELEVDIEGAPSVDKVIDIAVAAAASDFSLVLALQAYLNRTITDVKKVLNTGVKVRLIKGAYKGDISDFNEIQSRFIDLFEVLLASGKDFDVGTHDPVLLQHMLEHSNFTHKQRVSFGFLKGLADQTKLDLTAKGYRVAEYVPYGNNRLAYVTRRHAYLKLLQSSGLNPAQ